MGYLRNSWVLVPVAIRDIPGAVDGEEGVLTGLGGRRV